MEICTEAVRTAIQWDIFSIAPVESVHLSCPSADSAVLNNVTGGSISHLMGGLSSNGATYIINLMGTIKVNGCVKNYVQIRSGA